MLRFPLDRHYIREYFKHPKHFLQTSIEGGKDSKTAGARLKVEVTSRLALRGKPSLDIGWKELDGKQR
jgi:hypothetical protein